MKSSAAAVEPAIGERSSAAVADMPAPPLVPNDAIDLAHLERMTGGDHALECELLELFDRQTQMLLVRIAQEPPKVVAALAHTLTGSARGVGAWKVAQAAEVVERLAAEPIAALTGATSRLTAAVGEARATIATLLQSR